MTGRAIGRLTLILCAAGVALVVFWAALKPYLFDLPPGDYEVRQGDILLPDGKYEAALERFEAALAVSPDHRGALMGKAIAHMQNDHPTEAEAAFTRLIEVLSRTLAADDPTGRGVLAGAYANRGILYDRLGRYEAALADYRQALSIDADAVDGPGLLDRILYGNARPATVRRRAAYLESQLTLPEDQRRMRMPELDARQRMHKP